MYMDTIIFSGLAVVGLVTTFMGGFYYIAYKESQKQQDHSE
jgi:hypothetical protein